MLVWMDLEMTGLDPATDVIVEIATLITDDDLALVAEGPDLVIHHADDCLAAMNEVVTKMWPVRPASRSRSERASCVFRDPIAPR